MFALIAWTSLISLVGNLRASMFDKSGHAIIVYRGFNADKPKEFR